MSIPTTQRAISAAESILKAVADEASLAKAVNDDDPRFRNLEEFAKQNIVRTQLVSKFWRQLGRQTLVMHPAVVDEVRVSSSDRIPGEALRVLPYINPLVLFADPPVFDSWVTTAEPWSKQAREYGGEKMRLLGFFTFGSRVTDPRRENPDKDSVIVEQLFYGTNDPMAQRFGMLLVFEALDERGRVIDIEWNTMSVDFNANQTFSETVEELMGRFQWDCSLAFLNGHERDIPGQRKESKRWMRDVLSVVIGSVFYLCSTSLEAEQVPASATRHLSRTIARKPLSLYRVGWTTGAALTRLRSQRYGEETTPSQMGNLQHQRDPEHRRGHFKMQPHGPRNTLRKLIWVSPYWTHTERLGQSGVNTIRQVPRVGAKGEARESVQTALRLR